MQWLKKLFCRHEYTYVRKTSGRICIQYKKCDKCGTNSREEILPIIHLEKKYNFSIVKGMAEAARLYNEYYKINMYRLENFNYSLSRNMYESAYNEAIKVKPKPDNTASIAKNIFCEKCGWPIIHVCCNDGMDKAPWGGDYWGYCSNKSCKNHDGEDWDQCGLSFSFHVNPKIAI